MAGVEIKVTSTARDVAGRFARLPAAVVEAERVAVGKAGLLVLRRVRTRFVGYSASGGKRNLAGFLQRRSGALVQSSNASAPERQGTAWASRVGFRKGAVDRYAAAQEYGATMRGSPYLAIPVADGLTAAGVARYRSPREVPGGFWTRSRRGALVFLARLGGRLSLLFVGRREVKVPASRILRRSAEESRADIHTLVQREIARALRA